MLIYNTCSRADQRSWVARYLMDPASGGCTGKNTTRVESGSVDDEVEVWVTESELGGPKYFNNMMHASIAIRELDSRPHEIASLAKENVLQYALTKKEVRRFKKKSESAEVSVESTLTKEQFEKVRDHMGTALEEDEPEPKKQKVTDTQSSGSKNPKGTPKKPQKSPEEIAAEKELRKATFDANNNLKKYREYVDKCAGELDESSITHLKKLIKAKGMPETMNEFIDNTIVEIQGHIANHRVHLTAFTDDMNTLGTVQQCMEKKGDDGEAGVDEKSVGKFS